MFVMMNRMSVPEEHRARFEEMFRSRARAVDRRPGFIRAEILKPSQGNEYIVVTHWESEQAFKDWVGSGEYVEGHKRAAEFKGADGKSALTSKVEMYEVLAT